MNTHRRQRIRTVRSKKQQRGQLSVSLSLIAWDRFALGTNRSSRVIISGEAIDFDVKMDSIEWRMRDGLLGGLEKYTWLKPIGRKA